MPDVELKFQGQSVGAVDATKSVDEALGDLAQQALETQAVLRQALDGVNGDPAEAEIRKVNNELEETQREAISTKLLLAGLFSGFDTSVLVGGLASAAGGFLGLFTSVKLVESALGDIKWPAIWAAVEPGLELIGSLAAALIAVVAAAAPAAGALVAIPSALSAIVQAGGTVVLAFSGIADALKAATDLQTEGADAAERLAAAQEAAAARVETAQDAVVAAHQRVADAERALELANRSLIDAHEGVEIASRNLREAEDDLARAQEDAVQAQRDLTIAREEAAAALIELGFRAESAALAERRAILDLADARADLSELEASGTATADELARARLRVEEAELRLAEAQRRTEEANLALQVAEEQGIENAPNVVAAKDNVRDANDRVNDATQRVKDAEAALTDARVAVADAAYAVAAAQQNLADAQVGVKESNEDLRDAQAALREAIEATTPAAEKFRDALLSLSPAGQAFVQFLLGLKPLLDDLRDTAAAGFLPGLQQGIENALPLFDELKTIIGSTATVLGNFAANLGAAFGSAEWQSEIASIGEQNVSTLDHLGEAVINLIDAFLSIVDAAGPFIEWMASGIERLTDYIAAAADAGQESGALAGFFDKAKQSMQLLWGVAGPLVEVLYDIGRAAAPLGREILRDLGDQLDRLSDWTGSEGGQETLRTYFENSKPAIYEAARLVRDIVGALLGLSASEPGGGALVDFMERLRTEVLPLFKEVADESGEAFGQVLADAIINILRLIADLSGPNGPLVALVSVVGDVVGVFADLLEQNPLLQDLVFTLTGLLTWAKLLSATGIVTFLVTMTAALFGMGPAAATAEGGMLGLNAAIRANPIGLIVTAIQLLVAAFIVAYTHSETFKNIVDATWAAIKEAVVWVVDLTKRIWDLIEPLVDLYLRFNPVVALFRNLPDIVRTLISAFTDVYNFVKNNWQEIATLLSGPFAPLVALATDGFGIRSALINAFSAVLTFLQSFDDKARSAASKIGDAIKDGVVKGITGVATEVEKFLNRIVDAIRDHIVAARNAATNLGTAIYNGIKNAVTGIATFVTNVLNNVIDAVRKVVTRAAQAGAAVGRAIAAGIRNAFSGVATTIRTLVEGAINGALRVVNGALGLINSALEFSINVPDIIPGLPDVIRFNPPNIPYIPYLAEGGIVTSPTLAVIGERGPEAVVPLDQYPSGGDTHVTVHVAGSITAERDLARTIADEISRRDSRRGTSRFTPKLAAVPR